MGDQLDAGNLLDDADVEAAQNATEPAEKPAEEPTPATPEPEPAPEPGEFDRSANFRDTLQGILEHVPEDKRKAVEGRIEQAERWASEANEAKELKARFGDINTFARELQDYYTFTHGEEILKDEGAAKFIRAAFEQLQSGTPAETADEPFDDVVDPADKNAQRLDALEKKYEADTQERQNVVERERLAKQFAADFDPRVEDVVKKMNLPEEKVVEAGEAFADYAQHLYMQNVLNSDNPESVTVASAVAQAAKVIDVIVDARNAKRSAPPRPTVEKAEEVEDIAGKDARELLDSLDLGDDIDEYRKAHPGA